MILLLRLINQSILMGLAFSYPENEGEAFVPSFKVFLGMRNYERSNFRSVSFDARDSEPALIKIFGSGKLIIKWPLSLKRGEVEPSQLEAMISITNHSDIDGNNSKAKPLKRPWFRQEPQLELRSKHKAALKFQKVYRSFRTRRQLADCAVLVEQRWWQLLDFALLKRSSVSFFDTEKPESIVSKWSRARTRAARVGKGLSKNERARKLALQHWLEAIDPRHRYGHNLRFYYDCWLRSESKQPFFYWLDVGEGKEVNVKNCTRSTLQQQCIKYLGPKEREDYEVIAENGKLIYKKNRKRLDTSGGPIDSKWIFVLSTIKNLYVGQKRKGKFQHSSFLAGGATLAAGRLIVENGVLKAVWPHSGHYCPTKENFAEFMSFLKENKVDLTDVKKAPVEDGNEFGGYNVNSQSQLRKSLPPKIPSDTNIKAAETKDSSFTCEPKQKIYKIDELDNFYIFNKSAILTDEEDEATHEQSREESAGHSLISKRQFELCKPDLVADSCEEPMLKEEILHRLSAKEGVKSYQLGEQLSFKWTTGAGPRIGCVRDYPSELQLQALEQVSLSPRDGESSRSLASPRNMPSPRTKMQEELSASPQKSDTKCKGNG